MNGICRDIFKAVHQGKWLSIEYKNKGEEITKYWIGIRDIVMPQKVLKVEGHHLSKHTTMQLSIYVDSILSSSVLEGTYMEVNQELIADIKLHRDKYAALFSHVPNLKILNYLADCNRLDSTPYKTEYALVDGFDGSRYDGENYALEEEQFQYIVNQFQYKAVKNSKTRKVKELALNILSIPVRKGLYVLAYKRLYLDVKHKILRPSEEITICKEFTIDGEKQSVRQFLDAEEYELLDDFEQYEEYIKDQITKNNPQISGIDDMPYLIAVGRETILNLETEYKGIMDQYAEGTPEAPLKAFFGDMVQRPVRRKDYPLALLNRNLNIDQLLAIHNGIKYPVAYVQGPPGTGKTHTILNTIITAFFLERTVLFGSYNNHPIDGVFQKLIHMEYRGKDIPFPVVRLGNNDKMAEALDYMKEIYERTKDLKIYDKTLERNRDDKIERTKQLTELLKKHEERIELLERKETIQKLLNTNSHLRFQTDLYGRQLAGVKKRLEELGTVTDEQVRSLLSDDEQEFKKYLYYTSAKYIKRLGEPKNKDLLDIINLPDRDRDDKVAMFNKYLGKEENLKKFLRIFPIAVTTCISAHKIGEPKPYFDMVVLDEASQCNTALSLVPIVRGKNLMLVGDPQQLNPVILLDPKDNLRLKREYSVSGEYDYIANSVYKTYLANDSVNDEVLLSYHYRCHEKIIAFNNKKYYNGKLRIKSKVDSSEPLKYIDIKDNGTDHKNTAPAEAEEVLEYAAKNKGKSIGVITPFVNQKEYINQKIKEQELSNISCGTVHAFQGDEKDIIFFSMALTDKTHPKTYAWFKNSKELINVAVSRAKEQLIVLGSSRDLERLHQGNLEDDVYELVEYTKSNGVSQVTERTAESRALGVKPYSTQTENFFLTNLNHALSNVLNNDSRCVVRKEVGIAHVFRDNILHHDLFYTGRFDFVVYKKEYRNQEVPILAIELDGKEHLEDEVVRERDKQKNAICREHHFELIRVENSYARRYQYIKTILNEYFTKTR